MFTMTDFIVQGISGLIKAFESGFEIEGEVLYEAWDELGEYEKDCYYEDFESCGRWDIPQALIYQFKPAGKFYRIWREVGLTEMQETYFETQVPEIVSKQRITIDIWKEVKSGKKNETLF